MYENVEHYYYLSYGWVDVCSVIVDCSVMNKFVQKGDFSICFPCQIHTKYTYIRWCLKCIQNFPLKNVTFQWTMNDILSLCDKRFYSGKPRCMHQLLPVTTLYYCAMFMVTPTNQPTTPLNVFYLTETLFFIILILNYMLCFIYVYSCGALLLWPH